MTMKVRSGLNVIVLCKAHIFWNRICKEKKGGNMHLGGGLKINCTSDAILKVNDGTTSKYSSKYWSQILVLR